MNTHNSITEPEMLPAYDFSGKQGVRGKYYQAYRQGHTVNVTQEDGTVTTQYFTLEMDFDNLTQFLREWKAGL